MSKTFTMDALETLVHDAGLDDVHIYPDYSGRAMYGKECFGIVCDVNDFAMFCATVGSNDDDWGDWLHTVRTDSMGRSTIWYWPRVTVVNDDGTDYTTKED